MNLELSKFITYNVGNNNVKLPCESDKIILPESILEELVNNQKALDIEKFPHPLVFKLSTIDRSCYVGIKEFSPNNDTVLTQYIVSKLGLQGDATGPIQLQLDLALNMSNIDKERQSITIKTSNPNLDWKSLLEARLPQSYTVVTTGDILHFKVGNKDYSVKVTKVSSRSVCVVDRDIDLIVESDSVMDINDANNKEQSEWPDIEGFIDVNNEGTNFRQEQGERIAIEVSEGEMLIGKGEYVLDFNEFVSPERFIYGSMMGNRSWANNKEKMKVFIYTLAPTEFSFALNENEESPGNIDDEHIRCKTCQNVISKSSQLMHESFCRRNNITCDLGCGEVFLKQIPDSHWHCCDKWGDDPISFSIHDYYYHSVFSDRCESCNIKLDDDKRITLALHRANDCPMSLHSCRYCHLHLSRGEPTTESKYHDMSGHEWECGAKTMECEKCNKLIRRRDWFVHYSWHEKARIDQQEPKKCQNELCIRCINNSNNKLGLCDICFGPLYNSNNDPDDKLLINRIERRYVLQLKNGCRRKICENSLCGSSAVKINVDTQSMVNVIKYVKGELMPAIRESIYSGQSYHYSFCVDEGTTMKLRVSKMFEEGECSIGWICKAIEVNGLDINKIETWLENNAVRSSEQK
ncbi:hypothetical protein DAMA08_031460 [Martiniozyma asiatica (nom. inval.)]|nr:hypothetical protein DAMA08_031460 [Martiniozyma asiatica]